MNGRGRTPALTAALATGTCLAIASMASAGFITGSGEISNIQYGLVYPDDGTIDWFYGDGAGGPGWQGEAWAHVADSDGGADADYNTEPDGAGIISAFASTPLAWGSADINLIDEMLLSANEANLPVGGWVNTAPQAMMFEYFSLSPTVPGDPNSIDVYFGFDFEMHLAGQAEPGAPFYADGSVSMMLQYEDAQGDWQLVEGGQLFISEAISGSGTDSDDVTISGSLMVTTELDPDVMHAVQFTVYPNLMVPQPGAAVLITAGGLLSLGRRRR